MRAFMEHKNESIHHSEARHGGGEDIYNTKITEAIMKTYVCNKTVRAKPMTRGEYNNLRGWALPANECPTDPGYVTVDDLNWSKDTPEFQGYVSWLPKNQFECFHTEVAAANNQ